MRQDHLPVVGALSPGYAGSDLGAVPDLPPDALEPRKRGLLEDGFIQTYALLVSF